MATDIQIQIHNNQSTDQKLITIHPLSELKFKFTLPKYVLSGDFTSTNLDKEVNSDYEEDTYKADPPTVAKATKARESGWHEEIAFYSLDFHKFMLLDVDAKELSDLVNNV